VSFGRYELILIVAYCIMFKLSSTAFDVIIMTTVNFGVKISCLINM